MNVPSIAQFMIDQPLLGRLLFGSVEMLALALLVWLGIRLFKPKSARLVSFLWLLVLAKPLVALAFGPLVPIVNVAVPAQPARVAAMPVETNAPSYEIVYADEPEVFANHAATPVPVPAKRASIPVPAIILAVWLTGVALALLWAFVDRVRLRRVVRQADAPDANARRVYAELAASVRRAPRLRITDVIESPAIAGVVRPVIFMPRWLCANGNTAQLRWALYHELIHFRHGDAVANFVRQLTRCIFFFHPVAWWAGKRWEEAAERACDRALVDNADDVEDYAANLYELMLQMHQRRRPLMSGLFATRTPTGQRIATLLNEALQSPKRLGVVTVTTLIVASAVALTVGATVNTTPEDDETFANEARDDEPQRDEQKSPFEGGFRGMSDTLQSAATAGKEGGNEETSPATHLASNQQPGETTDESTESETEPTREVAADYQPPPESQWRPAFDAVYSLDDGEVMKYIPTPFIPERKDWYFTTDPSQAKELPNGLCSVHFKVYEELGLQPSSTLLGKCTQKLGGILYHSLELRPTEYYAVPALLDIELPGDWITRNNASVEERAEALEAIVRQHTGTDIRIEKRPVEDEVYVVRGRYEFSPIPESEIPTAVLITKGGHGVAGGVVDFQDLLMLVEMNLDISIVNEASGPEHKAIAYLVQSIPGDHDQIREESLESLERQTNLTFTRERRDVERWFVTEAGQDESAVVPGDSKFAAPSETGATYGTVTPGRRVGPLDADATSQRSEGSDANTPSASRSQGTAVAKTEGTEDVSVYRLDPGQRVKHIAPPFPDERKEYYSTSHRPNLNVPRSNAGALFLNWYDTRGITKDVTFTTLGDKGPPLRLVLNIVAKITAAQLAGDPAILDAPIPGDWITDSGASVDDRIKAIEAVARNLVDEDISIAKRTVEDDVIVVRGDYAYRQHPGSTKTRAVMLFAGDRASDQHSGGGSADIDEFLVRLSDRTRVSFINETNVSSDMEIHYRYHPSTDLQRTPTERHDEVIESLLENLAYQTGLTFTRERRDIERWIVAKAGQAGGAVSPTGAGAIARPRPIRTSQQTSQGAPTEDGEAETESIVVYRPEGDDRPLDDTFETRYYEIEHPIIAEDRPNAEQSSALSHVILGILNDPFLPRGTKETSFASFNPATSQLIVHSAPEVLEKFEEQLPEWDQQPRYFSVETKVIAAPAATIDTVVPSEFQAAVGDAIYLGVIADAELIIDALLARDDVALLSAPRVTTYDAKWPFMPKIVAPQKTAEVVEPSRMRGAAETFMSEFNMDALPTALITDVRQYNPQYRNEAGETETLDTPLWRGFAIAPTVRATGEDEFSVEYNFRIASPRPNTPEIFANEAAARDALHLQRFTYRYTQSEGETIAIRLDRPEFEDALIIFVRIDEIAPIN